MRVGIVVLSYRQAHFLGEAIASIRAQTLQPSATVIVAGSAEDYEAGCELATCIHAEPCGISDARNRGIDYLGFQVDALLPLDADDTLAPTAIEALVAATPLGGKLFITSSDVQEFGDRSGVWCLPPLALAERNSLSYASLFSRELWRRAGGYDPAATFWEDWDFWLRCARHSPQITQVRQPLLNYRIHAGQKSAGEAGQAPLAMALLRLRHPECYSPRQLAEARRAASAAT